MNPGTQRPEEQGLRSILGALPSPISVSTPCNPLVPISDSIAQAQDVTLLSFGRLLCKTLAKMLT